MARPSSTGKFPSKSVANRRKGGGCREAGLNPRPGDRSRTPCPTESKTTEKGKTRHRPRLDPSSADRSPDNDLTRGSRPAWQSRRLAKHRPRSEGDPSFLHRLAPLGGWHGREAFWVRSQIAVSALVVPVSSSRYRRSDPHPTSSGRLDRRQPRAHVGNSNKRKADSARADLVPSVRPRLRDLLDRGTRLAHRPGRTRGQLNSPRDQSSSGKRGGAAGVN